MNAHKLTLTTAALLFSLSIATDNSYAQESSLEHNGAPEGVAAAAPVVRAADATPAGIGIEIINFQSDTPGIKPNGWQSVDSETVSFTDSNGSDLNVYDYDQQSDGQALAVNTDDDDSHLIMNFSKPVRSISMDFGNDDPGWSSEGDVAELKVFDGGSMLGSSQVVMNRNDVMDQNIAVSGVGCFDSATFKYNVTQSGGLIEVVDNIQLELCNNDLDGDGVFDEQDNCPATTIGDVVNSSGCSIDQLCPCENGWTSHNQYAQCVIHTSSKFFFAKLLTRQERIHLIAVAAHSPCGRP